MAVANETNDRGVAKPVTMVVVGAGLRGRVSLYPYALSNLTLRECVC